jgi:hypothetical protein
MEAVNRMAIKHHFAYLPRVLIELIGRTFCLTIGTTHWPYLGGRNFLALFTDGAYHTDFVRLPYAPASAAASAAHLATWFVVYSVPVKHLLHVAFYLYPAGRNSVRRFESH